MSENSAVEAYLRPRGPKCRWPHCTTPAPRAEWYCEGHLSALPSKLRDKTKRAEAQEWAQKHQAKWDAEDLRGRQEAQERKRLRILSAKESPDALRPRTDLGRFA